MKKDGYRILAVTACPTGIAHTFMAAEALETTGAKLGYAVKAETNGSGGVKNRLTKEEIENCDGIIIAEDEISSLKRFKDDMREVAEGYECGVGLGKFNDIKEGDMFEAFIMEEVKR